MAEISLSRSKTAIIDDADINLVEGRTWVIVVNGAGNEYAGCRYKSGKHWFTELMHRTILGVTTGNVDHINGNGLDNRRENLRPCTTSQNLANTGLRRDNKTGAKGIWWTGKKWEVRIRYQRRRFYLGTFTSKIGAVNAYNEAAIRLHGEFARVNPIAV